MEATQAPVDVLAKCVPLKENTKGLELMTGQFSWIP